MKRLYLKTKFEIRKKRKETSTDATQKHTFIYIRNFHI